MPLRDDAVFTDATSALENRKDERKIWKKNNSIQFSSNALFLPFGKFDMTSFKDS